jgi:hypothetical protein
MSTTLDNFHVNARGPGNDVLVSETPEPDGSIRTDQGLERIAARITHADRG